jgi:hypothetical protein
MNTTNMLVKVVIALSFLSLGTVIAQAQLDNSCTYSYSFGKGQSYFAFCLTPYGTLASLQGASGNNLLDPNNPIEGFVMCDESDYDYFGPIKVVPGLGLGGEQPSVSQPKGVGKLPIIFGVGLESETVTAIASTKTVVFTIPWPKIDYSYEFAFGPIIRVMGLGSTGSTLSTSEVSAFAYTAPGDLVMLNGSIKQFGKTKMGGPGVSSGAFGGGSATCTTFFQPPVSGEGFIFDDTEFQTVTNGTAVFSYRVF